MHDALPKLHKQVNPIFIGTNKLHLSSLTFYFKDTMTDA